jgi:hypothetical protein
MSWENDVNTRQKEVEKIIRDYWIKLDKFSINDDGTIDIDGNVEFSKVMNFLTELPLKFNKVSGDFDCSRLSLITLKGCPIEVGGAFDCSYNQLNSLVYLPRKIGTLVIDNMIPSLSTSGINCRFNEVVFLFRTNIPNVGLPPAIVKYARHIKTVLHYQNYFDVWNEDLSLNEANFDEIIADIFDGLE